MDVSGEELIRFWRTLNENNVRYIMVGGFATRKAFLHLGYGDFEELERVKFVPGFSNFHIGGGIELDIMTEMKGLENVSFDECLRMASVAELDGVKVPFLHINHLIDNKKVVNRPKDQVDIIELEKIRQLREEG
jgi:hypothetical protein